MFSSLFHKRYFLVLFATSISFSLCAENTSELEKKKTLAACFATAPRSSSLISAESYQELQVDKIIQKFDRTITAFGTQGFNNLQPTSDGTEILRRQNIIKNLVNDTLLYETFVAELTTAKQYEDAFLGYWDKGNKIHSDAEKLYFSRFDDKKITETPDGIKKQLMLKINALSVKLNASVPALEATSLANVAMPAANFAGRLCFAGIINYIWEKSLKKIKPTEADATIDPEGFSCKGMLLAAGNFPIELARMHSPKPFIYKDGYKAGLWLTYAQRFSGGDRYINLKDGWGCSKPFAISLTTAAILWNDATMAWGIKTDVAQLKVLLSATASLYDDTVKVASFIKQIEWLIALANQNQLLSPTSSALSHDLTLNNVSEKLARVLQLLKTATFDDNQSLLYSRGRLLVAHALLKEIKDEIKPFLNVVAEIDALVSIATVYKEYEPRTARFCFPAISTDALPHITLNNFWPSLMDHDKAILNSCDLGAHNAKDLLFSGPNGTGKSITMKAVAQLIVMFQSWGIASAQAGQMTLFTRVETHMHPQEDLSKNQSTFVAQFSKLQDIKNSLANATPNDRFFLILDEPLNGTVEAEAAKRVYNFGFDVAQMPQCCVLMATHFEKPTELETATSGTWKNVHLGLLEAENNFTPTFVITPGKQDWWFNDHAKRSRYIDCLALNL